MISSDLKIYVVIEDRQKAHALNISGSLDLLKAFLEALAVGEMATPAHAPPAPCADAQTVQPQGVPDAAR